MRNIRTTAMIAGFCGLSFSGSLAGAELPGKIDNVTKLGWLELRTQFAAVEGHISPRVKQNHRTTAIGDAAPNAPSVLNILGSDLHAAWDLVRQRAQLAAKYTSKHLDQGPAGLTGH